jgi:hypothetical protein
MPTASAHTCICAWCNREEVDGEWRATPARAHAPGTVTHGICDACAESVLRGACAAD